MKEMFDKIIIFFNRALKDVGTKFTFRLATPIKWPNRCAVCNKNPDVFYNLYGRVIKGKSFGGMNPISLFTLRYPLKIVISFPVCQGHCFQMECIKFLKLIFLCAAIIFGFLVLSSSGPEPFLIFRFIKNLFLFFISLGFYNFLLRIQPVRLIDVGNIFFTIVIKDKDYAKEFASMNEFLNIEMLSVEDKNKDILSLNYLVLVILIILLLLVLILNSTFLSES